MLYELLFPDFILRILLAALAGILIGLEREVKRKSAGIKTNSLVALGASAFVLTSMHIAGTEGVDPSRVLSQVVTGIGFLGAGVIIYQQDKVHGLTTAATIWCSAATGCMAALGLWRELISFTILVIMINVIFGWIDKHFGS